MAVPNVSGALRGWTKPQTVRIVTKTVVNHLVQQTAIVKTINMMLQPLNPWNVERKPPEQRTWKWYSILTHGQEPDLEIDSQIIVEGIAYRVNSLNPWKTAGYKRYEATEDYSGLSPMYALAYSGNGSTGGTAPGTIAYQEGAQPEVASNLFTRTGFTFSEWNTKANGSGTDYDPDDILTIGTADVTLYAQWEAIP